MAVVLVVDDEPDIRYLTQVNLEMDGHKVRTAGNGREAIAAVEAEVPDLVLLDVMMPEVDGWSVLESLKSHFDDRIRNVKVLMMTALGADMDRIRGGVEGAIRYLVKPVPPDELRTVVLETLDAGPEPDLRRATQTRSLEALARREKGDDPTPDGAPRPRLSALEHLRPRAEGGDGETFETLDPDTLTDKQRQLLRTLAESSSVSAAAAELGVSRSNVYASLRRVGRKLGVDSVPELLRRLRAGLLTLPE